jgi:hypothetical protein
MSYSNLCSDLEEFEFETLHYKKEFNNPDEFGYGEESGNGYGDGYGYGYTNQYGFEDGFGDGEGDRFGGGWGVGAKL